MAPMVRDRVGDFFREKTMRRLVAVVLLLAALATFRPLLLMFVFFVAFERAIGAGAGLLQRRAGLKPKAAVLAVLAASGAVAAGAAALGVDRAVRAIVRAKEGFPHRLEALQDNPLYLRVKEHLPDTDRVVESAQHHAEDALHFVAALGHLFAYATIGLVLAIVFRLEHEELSAFGKKLDPESLIGTIVRWFRHVADAIAVTVQLQLIVALFNTVTTLPVLLILGVPHVVALMILVFFSALVPVVGNLVSGAVLSLLAFQAKGWLGVAIFVGLTFVLHKVEAYWLNPRLTARHVKLPGFVLIVSLLAFEHLFGFAGLFLSFPFLFVAGRIRAEWRAEDEPPPPPAEREDEEEEEKVEDDTAAPEEPGAA